jgi:hypothetical protein
MKLVLFKLFILTNIGDSGNIRGEISLLKGLEFSVNCLILW